MIKCGNSVELNPIEEENLKTILKWRNNPDLNKYFREYRVLTYEHQHKWWQKKVVNDPSWQYFCIHVLDDVIGVCGLINIHPVNRSAEIAFFIGDANYQELGFGFNAVYGLMLHGFNNLNLNRIWAEVYSNNPLLEKYVAIGFTQEGVLRETYYYDGRYWDSHMLSVLKKDFGKLSKNGTTF